MTEIGKSKIQVLIKVGYTLSALKFSDLKSHVYLSGLDCYLYSPMKWHQCALFELHYCRTQRTSVIRIQAVGTKQTSIGLKLSDLIDNTRLLLGLVSYFFRFSTSLPVFGLTRSYIPYLRTKKLTSNIHLLNFHGMK